MLWALSVSVLQILALPAHKSPLAGYQPMREPKPQAQGT